MRSSSSRLVIPPIRTSVSSSSGIASKRSRRARRWPAGRRPARRTCRSSTCLRASGMASVSREQVAEQVHLDARGRAGRSANASCSCWARLTHSTSSKRNSSLLLGVSRLSSSPGRCRITRLSRPTSESTWSAMASSFCSLSSQATACDRPRHEGRRSPPAARDLRQVSRAAARCFAEQDIAEQRGRPMVGQRSAQPPGAGQLRARPVAPTRTSRRPSGSRAP